MAKTTSTAAEVIDQLAQLKTQEQAICKKLNTAQREQSRLEANYAEARNQWMGYQNSSTASTQALATRAQAEMEQVRPLLIAAKTNVDACKAELEQTKNAIDAIADGPHRLAIAKLRYQRTVATETEARDALQDALTKHAAATQTLAEAERVRSAAERARAEALDPEAMTAARADLDAAQHRVDDNRVLCDNLQRRVQALTAALTEARTEAEKTRVQVWEAQRKDYVDAVRAQMAEPLRTAFATAVSAGHRGPFATFVFGVFCPTDQPPEIATVMGRLADDLGVPAEPVKWPAATG